jgi:hypothetical protein
VTSIREVLPRPFVLGVKLNSSDYVGAGSVHNSQAEEEAEDRAVAHVVDIARWDMIDFIEISGGDYENPGTTSFLALFTRHTLRYTTRLPCHGSPSLLRSLCAQSKIRHPCSDVFSAVSTSVGSTHRWNANTHHFSRSAFSRTRRPHWYWPRKRARSRLTAASQGALLTRTNWNPRSGRR